MHSVAGTKRVALYARVSTDGQSIENQLGELRAIAERHSWEIVGEYVDRGISGAKGRDQRPQFNAILNGVARKEFDMVAAWSVDRLGRSLQHLIGFLNELHAKKVDLYLHQQGIDTTTPAGRAMFSMLGVFGEFERSMIQERVRAGLKRAVAQGRRLGRPMVGGDVVKQVLVLRKKGQGYIKIAKSVGIGVGTVVRIVREGQLSV
jgi:DNA invertase Pin-like site-specific DNA recombinase